MNKFGLYLIFLLGIQPAAFAADLLDVYQQALDNDPTFKAAYSTYMSNAEAIPQALAALLPQMGVTAQTARNLTSVTSSGLKTTQTYDSDQWQLTATQAIFNFQAWTKVKQAKASVKASYATFNSATQDLILRTANAYLDILFAKDTLAFAEAKLRANKRQLDQAEQRFNVGLDAITSVYEAKAAYDQSIAEVISAKNNQVNRNENLRKLTNHVYEQLAPLRNSRIPLVSPEPNDVTEWISTGLKQNYNLLSAKYNLEAARENIKSAASGSWPTFAIQGTSGSLHNHATNSNVFIPSMNSQSNIGVTMNFPFFQGGLVTAQTKQAQYDFQTVSERLEETYRDVEVNSRIAFNTINDGIGKVKADRQTVISQKNKLDSTEAQFQVGTRTMVDVVNAQRQLFESQEQLANDQYQLINATLRLKFLAGSLNVNDLEEINSWLDTTRINGLPSFWQATNKKLTALPTKKFSTPHP